ncbi:MAG TPA: AMP-binding protein, partial [Vicinamibacterales bacterium]|nr:AMP-binding protein [Vicinamibacterales bacterium]
MARDTLIDFFADLSQARGEFLVYDDGFRSRGYSYGEVAAAARVLALRLHALGLRKGDKVVFWSENRPEWIVAFWACLLRGIVVVPIDYRASPDFLARVVRIVSARLILIGQDVPPLSAPAAVPVWKLHELEWGADVAPALPAISITKDDI